MQKITPLGRSPQIVRLVFHQFQKSGFIYASQKYLLIILLFKLSAHLRVSRSLSLPQTKSIIEHYPTEPFKYLHKYLALSFNTDSRSSILANHYQFLSRVVAIDFIDRICRGFIHLWEEEIEGNKYAISLTYPENEEGEFFLIFTENASRLFTLSFTIAPGKLLNVSDDQVIFIGRLQGVPDRKDAIRHASKFFHDTCPASLLLAAVRGVAAALDISGMVGVSARNQVCGDRLSLSCSSQSSYDEFYVSAGGQKLNEEFYYLSVTPNERPISSIKNNHRSRVKRKRELKRRLSEQIFIAFKKQCLQSGGLDH
ncbi:MAG: hypothetical protein FD173_1315 [Gallionellaceae bacterium]|nr:MAG: hypothetical protein FD173_1315 [Gallionellaceae bacterium]